MRQDNKAPASQGKTSGGLLGRVFGRGEHETAAPDAPSGSGTKSTLNLADIQGFILRGYRMPMVRHFLLTVGFPQQHASSSDGSSAATNLTPPKSPLPKTGM